MNAELMVSPSSLMFDGIKLEKVQELQLFKFTEQLQMRMEELLMKKKSDLLTSEEVLELEGIGELDRIFTYANSLIAVQSQCFPSPSDNSSANEQNTSANTAILQKA